MDTPIKNYGFVPDQITPDHWLAGASPIPDEILQSDGNWKDSLPADEFQRQRNVETYNCTGYGTDHVIRTYAKRKFGNDFNNSERAVGIAAGTGPMGNSPHVVAETIRTVPCMIPEAQLPFDESITSIEQYYSPKPLTPDLKAAGKTWLGQFKLLHDWVPPVVLIMREKLKSSPLGVAVYAWAQDSDGLYYRPAGAPDNHWGEIYWIDDSGKYYFFDSYDNTHKVLRADYTFTFVKRYYLEKITADPVESFWRRVYRKVLSFILRVRS